MINGITPISRSLSAIIELVIVISFTWFTLAKKLRWLKKEYHFNNRERGVNAAVNIYSPLFLIAGFSI